MVESDDLEEEVEEEEDEEENGLDDNVSQLVHLTLKNFGHSDRLE